MQEGWPKTVTDTRGGENMIGRLAGKLLSVLPLMLMLMLMPIGNSHVGPCTPMTCR